MKTLVMALLIFALSALVLSAFILAPAFADDQIDPLNQIERFAVKCVTNPVPNGGISGVRLEWDMAGEVGITQYHLVKDSMAIVTVPSTCPGCQGPASYFYEYTAPNLFGTYMLIPDVNSAIYHLASCEIPTAVDLVNFGAK